MLDIVQACKDANRIGITGHVNPDGDCVGSTLGMWQFLKKVFPDKTIDILLEKPQDIFSFIDGYEDIIVMEEKNDDMEIKPIEKYDIMMVIDTVKERTGNALGYVLGAKKYINIDHHISNPGEGDVSWVVPTASAAAEVVYDLVTMKEEYKAYMDKELAQTLYIGIIHDTGLLQYTNTSPKTYRIVANLVEFGFDFTKIIEETFHEKTALHSKMTGIALANATLALDGKVVVSVMDHEIIDENHATKKELGGIVSQLRYVKGADVSVFLYAIKPNKFKVSLRSRAIVDVSKVGQVFGGGGHVRASGCNIEGNATEIVDKILAEIAKQL